MSCERVLLVAAARGGASQATLVTELAAGVDRIVAVDGGADVCLDAGISPDAVIGDMDSISPEALTMLEGDGAPLERFPADKDVSDLDLALAWAASHGCAEAVITGAFGGRLDHTIASAGSLARAAHLRPRIVETDVSGWVLDPDARASVEIAVPGAVFSVFALEAGTVVTISGARWELERERLELLSSHALSNEVGASIAQVRCESGCCLVLVNAVSPSAV